MASRIGVAGLLVLALLGAGSRGAAAQPVPQLKLICASNLSGQLRYAARRGDCDLRTESVVALPSDAPVYACASLEYGLAYGNSRQKPVVVPLGTLWRAPDLSYCKRAHQRGIALGGARSLVVCAMRRDGLLRYVRNDSECHKREQGLIVPAARRAKRHKAESHKHAAPNIPATPVVKPPPPTADAQTVSTPEETPLSIVLGGASVPPGEPLTYEVATQPAHGKLSGTPPYLTYTPAQGYVGSDQLTFTVTQNKIQSAPATVAITVLHVDGPPAVSLPKLPSTEENAFLSFSVAKANAITVADSDAEGGVERLELSVEHGTLKLGATTGLKSSADNETASVTAEGTLSALDAALEGLVYTPTHNYVGSDTLTVQADDLGHTGLGGPKTATAKVAMSVLPITYDKALADAYTTKENETLTVAKAAGVLANDTDSDTPPLPLTAVLVSGPSHGTLTLEADGSLKYIPSHDFHGTDSFTYKDNDGNTDSTTVTVTLTVEPVVYDTAVADSYTTHENETLSKSPSSDVLANDTDTDSPTLPLTAVLVGGPSHGTLSLEPNGEFSYVPNHDFYGTDSFTYKDNDGNTDSNTVTVTLTVEPVVYDTAVADSYTLNENETLSKAASVGVLANDTDSDTPALPLSAVLVSGPSHGTLHLKPTGEFEYIPDHNFYGPDSFTYKDNDGNTESNTVTVTLTVEPVVYDTAVADAYTTHENETLSKGTTEGVLANDTDSDSPALPLTAVLVGGPSHGTLHLKPTGEFEYIPNHNFHGTDSFTYKDNDGNTDSNAVTVTLTVEPVVYDTAVADSYSLKENETLSKAASSGVLANDTDSDTPALPLTAALVSGPSHGTLKLESNGEFTYVPTHNFSGADSFTYKDNDGNTDSTTVTVTLTVEPVVYDTAAADSYTLNENETLSMAAPTGVLANDTDSDTPPLGLKAVLVGGPSHGSLKLNEDGSFEYVPDHNFYGTDSFTYKDNDGNTDSNTVTVTLTVEPVVYDTAAADSYATNENETLSVPAVGVLGNDTDSDSPPLALSAVLVSGASHGTLTLNPDGSFEYVPTHNYHGTDSFTYKDNDTNTDSNTVTVTLTVEPVVYDTAVADSYSLNENETLSKTASSGVLANDTDSDSPALSLEAVLVSGPSHGTLELEADGSLKYVPTHNFHGTDSFTYKDNDGNTDSNTVTVTLTIEPVVYDAAVADSYSLNENETLSPTATNGVLANDTDSDSPALPLKVVLVSGPSHGTLTLNADGSFEYAPTHNYYGTDSFTYKDNDGNTDSNTVTVTLTVNAVTYDKAVADSYSLNENETSFKNATEGVLANDTDNDSPALPLKAVLVSGPSHGTLTLNADGSFEYVPTHNYYGSDSFTYKDNDGNTESNTATVTLTVQSVVYDRAVADSYALNENETLSKTAIEGVLANDTDTDSPALSLEAVLVSGPSHGTLILNTAGSFEYTPDHNYVGTDSFTYKDNDTNTDSNTVTVTLTVEPVVYDKAVADSYTTAENETLSKTVSSGVLANDTDSDTPALPLSAVLVNGPSHGVLKLQSNGEFEYIPNHDFHGTDSFTYKDNDTNTDSNTVTVTLTIEPVVYDTAVADAYATHENEALSKAVSAGVLANDTDTDSPALPLAAVLVSGPLHGTLKLESNGEFTYVPTHNFHGTDSFTYKDNDGNTDSNTVTVTLTVEPVVYDTAVADSYTTHENETLSKTAIEGVLANDTDTDSPALPFEAVLVSGPSHGTLKLQSNGEFEYVPNHDFHGSDSFAYKDNDGNTDSNTVTVTLTVEPVVYDTAVADSYTTHENETLSKTAIEGVLANDTDADSPALTLEAVVVSGPSHGTLKLQSNGEFEYVPTHDFHGTDSFTYKDDDGNTESNTVTVTLTVEPVVYDTAVADSYTTHENEVLSTTASTGVLANDTDTDSPALLLQAVLVKTVEHGTLKLSSDGSFEYTPTHNYVGSDSFTYKDTDGNTESNTVTVTLTVERTAYDKAVADSYTANENETLSKNASTGVLANDTDSESLPLEAVLVTTTAHGTLKLESNGEFTYVPTHNFHGTDSFTYKDYDTNTYSNTVTVTLTVEPVVYDTAVADSYAVHENETLSKTALEGVLANDTDSDSPALPLEAVLVSGPAHGILKLESNGEFTYVPTHDFHGTDSFTYKDNDGNAYSNTVTVTLTVEAVVYDTAVADSYTAHENEMLSKAAIEGVLANDTDTDTPALALEAVLVSGPSHGTLTLKSDGSFEYTPTHNYLGSDSFTYKDNDGNTGSNTVTVTLTVEATVYDKAVADSYTTHEGTTLSEPAATGVLANDTDTDTPALILKAVLVKTTEHGTLKLSEDGSFEYIPTSGFHGEDTFTYKDNDGNTESNTATVTIEVIQHTDEAPALSAPTEAKVNENTSGEKTSVVFSKANSNQITMSDKDAEGGVEKLELAVSHGTLTPHSASGLTVTGSGTASLKLEGTLTAIGEGLEGLTYAPTLEYTGSDTLSLTANDLGHSGSGGPKTASASVSITVTSPNPTPINPTFTGAVGNTELSVGVARGASPDVEKSGSVLPSPAEGPDKSSVAVTAETIETEHKGTVSMNANGTFTYQPPVGTHTGTDKFQYNETDSLGGKATGTATIEFNGHRVWYAKSQEAEAGNGESNKPFKSLSSAESASASGDVVFLENSSSVYSGGIKLKSEQTLAGQDKELKVAEEEIVPASGVYPIVEKPGSVVVAVEPGDTVNGVEIKASENDGIYGTGLSGEVTISNDTILGNKTSSKGSGINLFPASTGTLLTLDVAHNTIAGQHVWGISVISGPGADVNGTVAHNTIGEKSVEGSGSQDGGGINILASGKSDTTTVEVSENTVLSIVGEGDGMRFESKEEAISKSFGATLNATVLNNTVEMIDEKSSEGLYFEAGNEGSPNGETLCLNAKGNTIKAAGREGPAAFNADAILLDVQASSTFKVHGIAGGGSNTEVAKLLEAENKLSTLFGEELVFIEAHKSFSSGTCPVP